MLVGRRGRVRTAHCYVLADRAPLGCLSGGKSRKQVQRSRPGRYLPLV